MPCYQGPRSQTHIEGDGQREEVGAEVAEDALEVVQVAPFAAAVGIPPDKVTAVRCVETTHSTALRRVTEPPWCKHLNTISLQSVPNPLQPKGIL